MEQKRRGRPPGDPTEQARLTPEQAAKLKAIAQAWSERDGEEWTVRRVLDRLAGKSIDRAYRRLAGKQYATGSPVA